MQKTFCRVPTYTRLSRYQVSLMQTRALRPTCGAVFLPLFDHCISLARSSHAAFERATFSGREYLARRAGRELAEARRVAAYQVCATCGAPIRNGSGGQCSAMLDRGQHDGDTAPQSAVGDNAVLRVTLTGSQTLTGMIPSAEKQLVFINNDTTDSLTLTHEGATSTAANRFVSEHEVPCDWRHGCAALRGC